MSCTKWEKLIQFSSYPAIQELDDVGSPEQMNQQHTLQLYLFIALFTEAVQLIYGRFVFYNPLGGILKFAYLCDR